MIFNFCAWGMLENRPILLVAGVSPLWGSFMRKIESLKICSTLVHSSVYFIREYILIRFMSTGIESEMWPISYWNKCCPFPVYSAPAYYY